MDPITFLVAFFLAGSPVFLGLAVFLFVRLRRARAETQKVRERYAPIVDQEKEVERIQREIDRLQGVAKEESGKIDDLRQSYSEKRGHFLRLQDQIAVYDERLALAELGVYEPHFEFRDSEEFKREIQRVRERQKDMIRDKTATFSPRDWTVDGSVAKGRAMMNRQVRLTMRAFNNECEAAIANVRWNNVNAMEKRILAAEKAINRENESMGLTIDHEYVDLKLKELFLTHEWRERQKIEKDERSELARVEREEKKLQADAERAEREEQKYQALLAKARMEAEASGGSEALRSRIANLEASLEEAHAASERARAMAEMTSSGYVYVISNAGSFGEDVVKIGLTRRLDPDDRVRELGDASVPFSFDTHAMIYSDEAPRLEAALHREFADRRINAVNMRKEFFRVTLDEVEEAVGRLAPKAGFFKDREAQEWIETLARRNAALLAMQTISESQLPESI